MEYLLSDYMYIMKMQILISAIAMLVLDSIYLTINKATFENQIAGIQRVALKINMVGVIFCYIFLIAGLYYFILMKKRPILDAFLFGIVIYGVYEMTNLATFKKWSPYVVILDTLWGGTLMAATTYITYKLSN
jgi:uncharacterized membrane protein